MKLNHTLKMAVLTAVGLLSLNLAASAQDAASTNAPAAPAPAVRPARAHRMTPDQLVKELGLTEDVATKFKAILADRQTQMAALRTDTSLSADDRKAKAKEIMEGTTAKLKDLLTADQLAKYKTLVPTGQRRTPTAAPTPAPGN